MEIELTEERRAFLETDFRRGFINFCGFRVSRIDKGFLESTLQIEEHHKTQDNFIHAGLIATMSDHSAGYAAYTLVPDDVRILTIEFKINFLKPAHGHAIRCQSEVISQGKQVIVAQSTVYDIRDSHEKMVSKCTITLMALHAGKLARKRSRP